MKSHARSILDADNLLLRVRIRCSCFSKAGQALGLQERRAIVPRASRINTIPLKTSHLSKIGVPMIDGPVFLPSNTAEANRIYPAAK